MNRIFIPIAIAAAIAIPTATHADNVTATCDSITVTADPGTRVHIGLDAEPPYTLVNGESGTFGFFKLSNDATTSHWYSIDVHDMVSDVQLSFVKVEIGPCGTEPFPADTPPLPEFVGGPAVVEPVETIADQVVVLDLAVWVDVALAPPW
jgi:hypothetical protein